MVISLATWEGYAMPSNEMNTNLDINDDHGFMYI